MSAGTKRLGALAAALALLGACSSTGQSPTVEATLAPDDTSAVVAPTTADSSTTSVAGLDAKSVLASTRRSIAFISTPIATGSGILLADGYVVTNAHVVDPFDRASITFAGGTTFDDVKVIGVDVFADVAVLGPIKTDAPPLEFEDPAGLVGGDELYLVGYPGETDVKPEPTISRGILSRLRTVPDFDQHYVQTDAAIAHGQSGGALLDRQGHVVGVSGLSYADDKFALALAAPDVQRAIDRIKAGKGSDYHPLPNSASDTKATLAFGSPDEVHAIYVPASPGERKVHLAIPDTCAWEIVSLLGDLVAIDKARVNEIAGTDTKVPGDTTAGGLLPQGLTVSTPISPGQWDVTLPADTGVILSIGTTVAAGETITLGSSAPFVSLADTDQDKPIAIGASATGIIDTYEDNDSYVIQLAVGDKISIAASSPQGDVDYAVVAPGETLANAQFVTDGGGGLYDLDAKGTYTATVAGPHHIYVVHGDDVATGYRLTVSRA